MQNTFQANNSLVRCVRYSDGRCSKIVAPSKCEAVMRSAECFLLEGELPEGEPHEGRFCRTMFISALFLFLKHIFHFIVNKAAKPAYLLCRTVEPAAKGFCKLETLLDIQCADSIALEQLLANFVSMLAHFLYRY